MALNYSNYDSSDFATFPESIAHARRNPMLIENLSNKISLSSENDTFLIQEPSCLFKDMINFFEKDYLELELPKEEHYRPEITAKRLYGSADFWYILLLVNNLFTIHDYNLPKIKYIPPQRLTKIQTFIKYSKNLTSVYEEQQVMENFI